MRYEGICAIIGGSSFAFLHVYPSNGGDHALIFVLAAYGGHFCGE
jgi:hypothetical protein